MARAKRPTIYDVAAAAGVATSTVSRAFSNPDRVTEATRATVLRAAKELGYRPNPSRALPSGRARTIAMLVSDITNPHYFEMIRGAEQRAKAAGLILVLVNTEESGDNERNQIEQLARTADGFVVASSRMADATIRELSREHHLVLISRELEGLPSAVVDHVEGSRQMVEHLASLGHRTLTYLGGPRKSWIGAQRWRSISSASRRLGLRVTKLGPFTPNVVNGGAAADAFLRTDATAAIAHNDLLAIGMLRRFRERGVRVPEDVSVAGFDDIFASELCAPALTTLGGPHEDTGRLSVELLLASAGSPGSGLPRRAVLPSHLVIRESTGPVRDSRTAG